jgi:DNA-directed RNA polymerase subunit K
VEHLAATLQPASVAYALEDVKVPKKTAVLRVEYDYTRFERARILGARALQISLGAPILADVPTSMIDPLTISEVEYAEHVIPITVIHRPPGDRFARPS